MNKPVAVITGANKGLGLALVRGLCQRWGDDGLVYLTARDPERGLAAQEGLRREGLHPLLDLLDLADEASVRQAATRLQGQHGGVDLLIHNGAYAPLPDVSPALQVRRMIDTNNLGTHRVLRAFLPLLRPQARLLVVASGFGTLVSLDPRLRGRFDTESLDLAGLEAVMRDYVAAVEQGRAQAEGWPEWINLPSKVGQVAATRIAARQWAADPGRPPGVLINAVCPGWMITDASRPYLHLVPPGVTPQEPDDAAGDVLWAGLLPPGSAGPMGELIQHRLILPWR